MVPGKMELKYEYKIVERAPPVKRPVGRPRKTPVSTAIFPCLMIAPSALIETTSQLENKNVEVITDDDEEDNENEKSFEKTVVEREGGRALPPKYTVMNKQEKLYLRAFCHIWSKSGEHSGWRIGKQVVDCARSTLLSEAKASTVLALLTEEKKLYEQGKGFRNRRQVEEALRVVKKKKGDYVKVESVEPSKDLPEGRMLDSKHYKELAERALILKNTGGFGPRTVKAVARVMFKEQYSDPDIPEWVPSLSWCTWFLKSVMNYSYRRITGKSPSISSLEKMNILF